MDMILFLISCSKLRAHDLLIQPLTLLIAHIILSAGIFLNALKISRTKPLFKQGKSFLLTKYRPISLLPSVPKHFHKDQFGFWSSHSTELKALCP